MGFEDRIQIQTGHAERAEIRKLLPYARKVAAEIIPVADFAVGIRRPVGQPVPLRVELPVGRNVLLWLPRGGKAVGKDLIDHAARQPVRRDKIPPVYRQLPARALRRGERRFSVRQTGQKPRSLRGRKYEIIPVELGIRRREMAVPPFVPPALHTCPEQVAVQHAAVVAAKPKPPAGALQAAGQAQTKKEGRALRDRAERRTVSQIPGIKQIGQENVLLQG